MQDLQRLLETLNTMPTSDEDYQLQLINTVIEIGKRVLHLEDKVTEKSELPNADIKTTLLGCSEMQLKNVYKGMSIKCQNNEDYFQLIDLIKEVCQGNGYDEDKVITQK